MMLALVVTRQGPSPSGRAAVYRRKCIVIFAPPPSPVTPTVARLTEARAFRVEDDSKWIYWMHTERAPTNAKRMLIKLSIRRPKRHG